jgi:hypothetical protein
MISNEKIDKIRTTNKLQRLVKKRKITRVILKAGTYTYKSDF